MSLLLSLPPGIWWIVASAVLWLSPVRVVRLAIIIILPVATVALLPLLATDALIPLRFISFDLVPLQTHAYSYLFAVAFCIVALTAGLYSHGSRTHRRELALGFLSTGAGLGIVYAGDFITLFFFWELLAVASLFLIWQGSRLSSPGAGLRYAMVHLFGGMLLLGGITAHIVMTDTILLTPFHFSLERLLWTSAIYSQDVSASSIAIWMIFAGITINAGMPPFSAWIADAYPESSPTGMPFLTTFATKSAIFALLTLFSGSGILLVFGLIMVVNGILMAMLENNIRRLLAHSMLVQLGVMLVAIALGNAGANDGAALHAFNHIIYTTLLTIAAGVVMQRTRAESFVDLGGLSRRMRFTCACAVVGVLSLAGLASTGGYIGKTLISGAVAELGIGWLWYCLTVTSALAMLYGGGRFLWFTFFQPAPEPALTVQKMSFLTTLALVTLVIFVFAPGLMPDLLVPPPSVGKHHFFTPAHILAQVQMVVFSSAAFFFFLPLLRPSKTVTLDTDWFYRRVFVKLVFSLEKLMGLGYTALMYGHRRFMQFVTAFLIRLTGPGGLFAETKTLANTTLIVAVLLAGYLLLYHYQS